MKLNRVLVTYKQELRTAHATAFDGLIATIARHAKKMEALPRTALKKPRGADLIVTIGGDGTVLAAAHMACRIPLLGVNFMPATSVGFFCAATAATMDRTLAAIARGTRKPRTLPMLSVTIDGRDIGLRALNDVLFAAESPAEMSRYRLTAGGIAEEQRSSGIWIAAGPGSSGAMTSAGGRRLPLTSARLQFLVREPCPLPSQKYRLINRVLPNNKAITIVSQMERAALYLDGHGKVFKIARGSRVRVRAVPKACSIYLP